VTLVERVGRLRALQGGNPDERALIDSPVVGYLAVTSTPGLNQTFRVALENRRIAFHKPFAGVDVTAAHTFGHGPTDPPLHECAAWRLAHAVGAPWNALVPCCVLRRISEQEGSLCERAPGRPSTTDPFFDPAQAAPAAFFDSLIAQQDRHAANYRWDDASNHLMLIDHGYAFARPGDVLNVSAFVDWRWRLGREALESREIEALRSIAQAPDLFGLEGVLELARATALRARAERMLQRGTVLRPAEF
jgi:hypothetical protein